MKKIDKNNYIVLLNNALDINNSFKKFNLTRDKMIEEKLIDDSFPSYNLKFTKINNYILNDLMHSEGVDPSDKNIVINNKEKYCLVNISETSLPKIKNKLIVGAVKKDRLNEKYIYFEFNESYKIEDHHKQEDPKSCDHCQNEDFRNQVFLIKDVSTNVVRKISEKCINLLFGDEISDLLKMYTSLKQFFYIYNELDNGNDRITKLYDKDNYLQYSYLIMKKTNGFIDRDNSIELDLKPSTYKALNHKMNTQTLINFNKKIKEFGYDEKIVLKLNDYDKFIKDIEISEESKIEIEKCKQWFKESLPLKHDSDRLKTIFYMMNDNSKFLFSEDGYFLSEAYNIYKIRTREIEEKEKEIKSVKSSLFIGEPTDKIDELEVRLTHAFLKIDRTYKYSDSIDYVFETKDGRVLKWKASKAQMLDCFLPENFEFNELKQLIANNKVWFNIKGSVVEHQIYKTQKMIEVPQTILNRISSISEYSLETKKLNTFSFNRKYNLNEFLLVDNYENSNKKVNYFTYVFKDKDNKEYKMNSFYNIEKLVINCHYKFPHQISNNEEICAFNVDTIFKIDSFTENFNPEILTKLKAQKFNI
jgi:hypothetical protein